MERRFVSIVIHFSDFGCVIACGLSVFFHAGLSHGTGGSVLAQ
jgi:hypothetical protein